MKIAILSTYDVRGGAAMSAYRLHKSLLRHGAESRMFVQSKTVEDSTVDSEQSRINRALNMLRPALDRAPLYPSKIQESFSTGLFRNQRALDRVASFAPDLLHLQWVNGGYFPLSTARKAMLPIVWRLPDWWLLTAGCHLPYDCTKYTEGCNRCHLLTQSKFFDRSAAILKWKTKILQSACIKFVVPSSALASDARKSLTLNGADVRVIPNGLDLEEFKPVEHKFCRELFGIPHDSTVILFGAANSRGDRNKGYKFLIESLQHLKRHYRREFTCVTFGSEKGTSFHDGIPVTSVGVLHDTFSLRALYSAADVMVVPSYQESFGQTAIEAMACGTPVAAFATSGLLDIVDSGIDGVLAKKFDVLELAGGINYILSDQSRTMRRNARLKVESKFDIDLTTGKYLKLYEETINEWKVEHE